MSRNGVGYLNSQKLNTTSPTKSAIPHNLLPKGAFEALAEHLVIQNVETVEKLVVFYASKIKLELQ